MLREIDTDLITQTVKELLLQASFSLSYDVIEALEQGKAREESPTGKRVFDHLLENEAIAREKRIPLCQDTGLAAIFLQVGQDVHIVGDDLDDAVNEGVRLAYEEGYLRKSMCHPLTRVNTKTNIPGIIHTQIVPGDRLKIRVMPKGGGAENMSRIFMLTPSAGWPVVKEKIIQTVADAGPNACPPLIVGVAIGGDFEMAPLKAKRTLLRPVGEANPDPDIHKLEIELLNEINKLGIGPQGLGGTVTALAVHVTMMECHIASLPLAINIQCHAYRHAEAVL